MMKIDRNQMNGWLKKAGQRAGQVADKATQVAGDLKSNANQNYQQYKRQKAHDHLIAALHNLQTFELDSKQRLIDFVKKHQLDINQGYDQMVRLDHLSNQTAMEMGRDYHYNPVSQSEDRLDQTAQERVESDLVDMKEALLAGMSNAKVQYRFAALENHLPEATILKKLQEIDESINERLSM